MKAGDAMADNDTTGNSNSYTKCTESCSTTFGSNSAALVACINGCATVNTPKPEKAVSGGGGGKVQEEIAKLEAALRGLKAAVE